ncbi:hypothetical protein [Streptomyces dangxiongensis]|uniref:hypothetical protein n=1 Tax=Streptomyces dangxiongensis TaxID=1442032 RepID=UPI0013CE67F2|nr:hypothetical protein [Streptomyces dangxiongensis]
MAPEILKHPKRHRTLKSGRSSDLAAAVAQARPDAAPDTVAAHTVSSVYAAMTTATAIAAGFHNGIGFDTLAHLTRPEATRP